jgi:hypothetical protein
LELANAVKFASEQLLEVHRGGQWQEVPADELVTSKALVLLNYRIPNDELQDENSKPMPGPMHYNIAQNLLVFEGGHWCVGKVKKNSRAKFTKQRKKIIKQRKEKQGHHKDDPQLMEAMRQQAKAMRQQTKAMRKQASRHVILIAGSDGKETEITVVYRTCHAPALFTDQAAMDRAHQAYAIELKEKHAFILDLFSGQKLDTRTQTATLQYRESERVVQTFAKDNDVDSLSYQRARKAWLRKGCPRRKAGRTPQKCYTKCSVATTVLRVSSCATCCSSSAQQHRARPRSSRRSPWRSCTGTLTLYP